MSAGAMEPAQTPAPSAAPTAVTMSSRCAWTTRELPRLYSFERERVNRWFDRLERYSDHTLRVDGDASAHAGRDAAIAGSRASRLGSLGAKRSAAARACDLWLLV